MKIKPKQTPNSVKLTYCCSVGISRITKDTSNHLDDKISTPPNNYTDFNFLDQNKDGGLPITLPQEL